MLLLLEALNIISLTKNNPVKNSGYCLLAKAFCWLADAFTVCSRKYTAASGARYSLG